MNQFKDLRQVFPGSDVVLGFSFKTVHPRGQSAHFRYLRIDDCFECMSPHMSLVA
ncbi:MAG: hypothetical protein FWD03_09360 [Defluviitaleaceae bacterium]|nr:hypothetical protein [Defluviitaleaceae bacterium]